MESGQGVRMESGQGVRMESWSESEDGELVRE